jgi:tetratricopeptide (TPR) repeat protein
VTKFYQVLFNNTFCIVYLLLILYLCCPVTALAQQNNPIYRLAKALEESNEYEEALRLYQNLYQKNLKNPEFINGIKRCYIALQSYQELITFLSQVIQHDGYNPIWNVDLAEAYYLNNQQEKALSIWWDQLEKAEGNIIVYRLVANGMIHQRLYDEAIKVYLRAIEKTKNHHNLHIDIGNLYKIQLDYGNAAKHFLDYYLHNPKQKSFLERQLLSLSDRDDQKVYVINSITNFLENYPDQSAVHEILAGIYIKGHEFNKAFEIYKYLDSKSSKGGYLQKFAFEAFKNEAYEHAIHSYKLMLKKDPSLNNKRQAQYNIAKSYAQLAYRYKEELKPDLAALNMERAVALFDSLANHAAQGEQNVSSYLFPFLSRYRSSDIKL